SFHPSAFLDVTRFKLSAFLRAQAEARVAKRRLSLTPDGLASQILSLAHNIALFRTHSQPTLGIALEVLARRRVHRHPSVAHARTSWSTRRSGRRAPAWPMRLGLRLCGSTEQNESRQSDD